MNKSGITGLMTACCLVLAAVFAASCSGSDYINAIPKESTMLISMNPTRLSGARSPLILKTLLHVKNVDESGLDLSANVYFFEDAQANLGLCAKVGDGGKLRDMLGRAGLTVTKKRECQFAVLPSGWVIGFSDRAALLMGPVVPAEAGGLMTLMARYLNEDEDDGIKGTPMLGKLDSISAPMAIVAQTQALPEQFVAPFTIGAPKGTDPADVVLAASMEVKDGRLLMQGGTFSFKKSVDNALAGARAVYRPIKGDYVKSMAATDVLGMFMNVDGQRFHGIIRQNQAISAMLNGINAAIDMDNILKSVDGDMAITSSSLGQDNFHMKMAARLGGAPWLKDVDYWKQSVPEGGRIGDWGKDCFYYTGGGTTYYFGVTPDMQYMSGGSAEEALGSVRPSPDAIDPALQQMIVGQRLVMVINFAALQGGKADAVTALLRPMFGNVSTIVYTLK